MFQPGFIFSIGLFFYILYFLILISYVINIDLHIFPV